MSQESFATGNNLVGDLYDVWNDNINGGVAESLIDDPNRTAFDVLRGWPLEGALTNYYPPKTGEAIVAGMVVSLDGSGELVKASSTATPVLLMVALDDQDSTTVVESGQLPVLTSNFVFRTDQLADVIGNYTAGASVIATAGEVDPTVAGKQIVGVIRSVDSVRGTVDIEVN